MGRSTADMLLERLLSPGDGVPSLGEGLWVVRMRVCRTCHGREEVWAGGEVATYVNEHKIKINVTTVTYNTRIHTSRKKETPRNRRMQTRTFQVDGRIMFSHLRLAHIHHIT